MILQMDISKNMMVITCYRNDPLLLPGHINSSCIYFCTYYVYFQMLEGFIQCLGICLLWALLTVTCASENLCRAQYFPQYVPDYSCLIGAQQYKTPFMFVCLLGLGARNLISMLCLGFEPKTLPCWKLRICGTKTLRLTVYITSSCLYF